MFGLEFLWEVMWSHKHYALVVHNISSALVVLILLCSFNTVGISDFIGERTSRWFGLIAPARICTVELCFYSGCWRTLLFCVACNLDFTRDPENRLKSKQYVEECSRSESEISLYPALSVRSGACRSRGRVGLPVQHQQGLLGSEI